MSHRNVAGTTLVEECDQLTEGEDVLKSSLYLDKLLDQGLGS